jgi:uncharacterized protein YgiM (DUF1202 family)
MTYSEKVEFILQYSVFMQIRLLGRNLVKKIALLVVLLSFVFGTVIYAGGVGQQLEIPLLVVNTSFLNARSGPGPQFTVITTLVGGTELPVLGSNGDQTWYLVTTADGNAWVDVSFTLARGSFAYVPEIEVPAAPVALATPLTIGLPGTGSASAGGTQSAIGSTSAERYRAVLQVSSVNLRNRPAEQGGVIATLFRNDALDFAIVGMANTAGVNWVQIVVPNVGIGWIEAPKVAMRLSAINYQVVIVTAGPVNLLSAPGSTNASLPPLFNGEEAFLINASGNLYQVELGNGLSGWLPMNTVTIRTGTTSDVLHGTTQVAAAAVTTGTQSSPIPVPVLEAGRVVINTSYQNVRTGPGPQYASIAVVAGGTELPVAGVTEDASWYLVTGDFGQGWVSQEFVVFRGAFSAVPVIAY